MYRYDGFVTACFGTCSPGLMKRTFLRVHRHAEATLSMRESAVAVTCERVLGALTEQGTNVLSVEEALTFLHLKGCRRVLIISQFLTDGKEWRKLCTAAGRYADRFELLRLTPPLLPEKAEECAVMLNRMFPAEKGTGIVLIGHGSVLSQQGYDGLRAALRKLGRDDIFVAEVRTVSGGEEAAEYFVRHGIYSVTLGFLMICAGSHAREAVCDGCGIRAALEEAGISVSVRFSGLGESDRFADLLIN